MRVEIRKIQEQMEGADYVTDAAIATSVHLAMTLKKPLLIEGPAGAGKSSAAPAGIGRHAESPAVTNAAPEIDG